MFAEPTVNDHLNQVRECLEDARLRLAREINRIQSEFMQHGAFGGSRMYQVLGEAFQTEFTNTVRQVLGELRRSVTLIQVDPRELRGLTVQLLEGYAREIRARAGELCHIPHNRAEQQTARDFLMIAADSFGVKLSSMLRQFDVGYLEPAKPEPMAVTNNHLNVGTNVGAIQQGSHGSTQSLSITLDAGAIQAALVSFEQAWMPDTLPSDQRAAIEVDLETVRLQLKKPSISQAILTEAGKSIRNLVEGVAAGMMTPQAIAAAAALAASLGA